MGGKLSQQACVMCCMVARFTTSLANLAAGSATTFKIYFYPGLT